MSPKSYVYLLDALASDASRTLSEYALSGAATDALEGISLGEGNAKIGVDRRVLRTSMLSWCIVSI
ncbi:hypothetical protein Ct61P_14901 [Colletotrichum tofieldiae]|nr:hypothetical protein Ct61P_14901 [Colletotrichum tofieldiae]